MKKYKLGNKIIETTAERYEKSFKELGYVLFEEKKEQKPKSEKPKN